MLQLEKIHGERSVAYCRSKLLTSRTKYRGFAVGVKAALKSLAQLQTG